MKTLFCDICGMKFRSNLELRRHEESDVHDKLPKNYECDFCDEKYSSRIELSNHLKNFHNLPV